MTQLESFTAYCKAHPEERFWQALRNWSEYSFILGAKATTPDEVSDTCVGITLVKTEDTFYKE